MVRFNNLRAWLADVLCRAGTVESRIRQLVMKLEFVEGLEIAHPFIKGFEQTHYCLNEEEVHAVAQGEISDVIAKRRSEDIEGKDGAQTVYSTSFYIGIHVAPKQRAYHNVLLLVVECELSKLAHNPHHHQAGTVGPRKLDISYPITEFTKVVKLWEKFEEAKMGIFVRNLKRFLFCVDIDR